MHTRVLIVHEIQWAFTNTHTQTCWHSYTLSTAQHSTQYDTIYNTNISHTQQQQKPVTIILYVPRTGTKKSNHSMLGVENVRTNICVISLFIYIHLAYLSTLHLCVHRDRMVNSFVCFFFFRSNSSFFRYLFWHQQYAKKINSNCNKRRQNEKFSSRTVSDFVRFKNQQRKRSKIK